MTEYLIIVALLVVIGGLIYQNDIDVKRAYKKGFNKGLNCKVIRMCSDNNEAHIHPEGDEKMVIVDPITGEKMYSTRMKIISATGKIYD